MRDALLRSVITGLLAIGLPLTSAQAEEQTCYQDQYVLTVNHIPALQEKAREALDSVTSGNALQISDFSPGAILVSPENSPHAGKRLQRYQEGRDPCMKLRAKVRSQLRALRAEDRSGIVRRFTCSCNAQVKALASPNDTYYSLQWGFSQQSNIDMNIPEAWDMTVGDPNLVVAVIDTGIDYTHPDLAGNMWTNPSEIAGNNIDDDNNGFIDDVHGMNAINNSGNPYDDNGHGTHVAGTIGARGNNGTGVVGVNWRIKMMGVKFLSGTGSGTLFDAIKSIDYVTMMKNRGVNIVLSNNSWGGGGYMQTLYDAIARAQSAGLLFVAAAGNSSINSDNNPQYPASYALNNVIAVAAVDSAGNLANFSNYGGRTVHVGAPGVNIASTYKNGGYVYLNGTSMAAPHVAGALALLKSYAPNLGSDMLKTILLRSGRPLNSLLGVTTTGKMVDLYAMLTDARDNGLVGPPPTVTPVPTATPTATPTRTATPTPSPTATPTPAPGFYAVRGRVIIGGAALVGAKVTLRYNGQSVVRYTGSSGEFSFDAVWGPVDYQLLVSRGGYEFAARSGSLTGNLNLDFSGTPKRFAVAVKILDASGQPLTGVPVNATGSQSAVTDNSGRASFMLNYGSAYSLGISDNNHTYTAAALSGVVHGAVERTVVRMK